MGHFVKAWLIHSGLDKRKERIEPESRKQAMRERRRLITLISAGRNRIVMIRRELPRTEDAGWAVLPYRTKRTRILLPRSARPAACTVARGWFIEASPSQSLNPAIPSSQEMGLRRRRVPSRPSAASRREALTGGGDAVQTREREWPALGRRGSSGRMPHLALLRFHAHRDGPEEAQQFPADGRHNLRFVLATGTELLVAGVQTPLRLPTDLLNLRVQQPQPFLQPAADPRFVLVGPGGFHNQAAYVGVSGLGNATARHATAAGMLAWDQAAVAHQLAGSSKTAERTDLGDDAGRHQFADAAQRLQGGDHFLDLGRRRGNRLVESLLQALDPLGSMFDFVHVIEKRRLQRRLFKTGMTLDPAHVLGGPIPFDVFRRPAAVAEKELSQAVARPG